MCSFEWAKLGEVDDISQQPTPTEHDNHGIAIWMMSKLKPNALTPWAHLSLQGNTSIYLCFYLEETHTQITIGSSHILDVSDSQQRRNRWFIWVSHLVSEFWMSPQSWDKWGPRILIYIYIFFNVSTRWPFFKKIYLFIFSCVGSLFLCEGFL